MTDTLYLNNNVRICRDGRLHSFHLWIQIKLYGNENRMARQCNHSWLNHDIPNVVSSTIEKEKKKRKIERINPEPNEE